MGEVARRATGSEVLKSLEGEVVEEAEYLKLLPASAVARLKGGEFLARLRMRGVIAGRHPSPEKGASTEFAEHREYRAGDDPRRLDWRAYARRDRYLVKEFVDETNLRGTLLLDASGSMGYAGDAAVELVPGEGPVSKFAYGRSLVAVLAHFLMGQGDAAGLCVFDEAVRFEQKPSTKRTRLHAMLAELVKMEPGGDTGLGAVLGEVVSRIPGRGLVMLVSDLFEAPEVVMEKLQILKLRGHEVVVFHVLAEEELAFPFKGAALFRDLEGERVEMQVDGESLRARYLERFGAFLESVSKGCERVGVGYVPLCTREPFEERVVEWVEHF